MLRWPIIFSWQSGGNVIQHGYYHRGNTMDISLYSDKFHFHLSSALCPSLRHSNDLLHPGCTLLLVRTNSHQQDNTAASSFGWSMEGCEHITHGPWSYTPTLPYQPAALHCTTRSYVNTATLGCFCFKCSSMAVVLLTSSALTHMIVRKFTYLCHRSR